MFSSVQRHGFLGHKIARRIHDLLYNISQYQRGFWCDCQLQIDSYSLHDD